MVPLDGLLWLLLLVGPLLVLQRLLHREIQAIFLILTRRVDIAMVLFSLLFFPGVFLHEISHFVMALMLGVKIGNISLVPKVVTAPDSSGRQKASRLQLGFVETARTDFVRDSLIGAAPLLAGSLFVIFAGLARLQMDDLWVTVVSGQSAAFRNLFAVMYTQPDFWLWFYLIFTVSSTMLPSASDRRGWVTLGFVFFLLLGLALLSGAGPWMLDNLTPIFNEGMRSLAAVFAISVVVHGILAVPVIFTRRLSSKITGLRAA